MPEQLLDLPSSSRLSEGRQGSKGKARSKRKARDGQTLVAQQRQQLSHVDVVPLDWEDAAALGAAAHTTLSELLSCPDGVDVVLASDCVYNEALVPAFVGTCAAVCALRPASDPIAGSASATPYDAAATIGSDGEKTWLRPTVCIVAQQIRSPDVFEVWLRAFAERFSVWRVPDEQAAEGMRVADGYVVHVGVLRERGDGDGGASADGGWRLD